MRSAQKAGGVMKTVMVSDIYLLYCKRVFCGDLTRGSGSEGEDILRDTESEAPPHENNFAFSRAEPWSKTYLDFDRTADANMISDIGHLRWKYTQLDAYVKLSVFQVLLPSDVLIHIH